MKFVVIFKWNGPCCSVIFPDQMIQLVSSGVTTPNIQFVWCTSWKKRKENKPLICAVLSSYAFIALTHIYDIIIQILFKMKPSLLVICTLVVLTCHLPNNRPWADDPACVTYLFHSDRSGWSELVVISATEMGYKNRRSTTAVLWWPKILIVSVPLIRCWQGD